MEIIDRLADKTEWEAFLAYKRGGGHLSRAALADLEKFVSEEEWRETVDGILRGRPFPRPKISEINKKNAQKKRVVFTFGRAENYVLKLIAFMLGDYDGLFPPNLYSFRRYTGVKRAVSDLLGVPGIGGMYSFKLDVSDYFNSVDSAAVLEMMERLVPEEKKLVSFLRGVLSDPFALKNGEPVRARKGIMAGMPVSAFLADVYLMETDRWFYTEGIPYARYSDDIIFFAGSRDMLERCREKITGDLAALGLGVNGKKVMTSLPGEKWEFLGFSVDGGVVDVSPAAVEKIKKKMKRKASALLRWKNRKGADSDRAVRAFVRFYDRKFFNNPVNGEITWCRWYFPLLGTDVSLKSIDRYVQDCIRYIVSGNYSSSRYNYRYSDIKRCGYVSLVNRYYAFRAGTYPVPGDGSWNGEEGDGQARKEG